MNAVEISSRDNRFVKTVVKLRSSAKARKETGLFAAEGVRLCTDAVKSGIRFSEFAVSETAAEKYSADVEYIASSSDKVYIVSDRLFKAMSDTESPQGVIGIAPVLYSDNTIKRGRYVALENIQDPSNLGAIARSAEAFGLDGMILSKDSTDAFSPKSLRASMGAFFRMPVTVCDNIAETLRNANITSFACVVDKNAKSICDVNFPEFSAVVIGNEGNGLTQKTKLGCDELITIPMNGRAESLNAAAAAAVTIWEMQRNL